MNYDIRKISVYFKRIHSRYYIDTNGVIYTSLSENTYRIMIDGKRININNFKKNNIKNLDSFKKMIIVIPETNNKYYLLYDGTIIQRLSTRIDDIGCVDVCLICLNGNPNGNRYKISRLMAGCFIGDVENKEVHHKNQNRTDNSLNNLEILTFEEHRGKNNHKKNHSL